VQINKSNIDWIIFFSALTLMLMSIAFVYSASSSIAEARFGSSDKLFWNHTLRVFIGLITLIVFIKLDYKILQYYSKGFIYLASILLVLVFFIGTPINGAFRWLYIGPINFQPSEIAKFAVVLHFSVLLTQRKEFIKEFKLGLLPFLVWSFIICGLIALQPNFSSAFVIYLICLSMMFIGNANLKHLLNIGFVSSLALVIYAVSANYRMSRIQNFLGIANVNTDVADAAFQSQQSILAFGNGGIFGMGPGQSRQSLLYLPEAYGDFIFSIIGEEYGFVGTCTILLIFALIAYRGIIIAKRAPDLFGYFLAFGITITISLYAFVSAAVNTGILPATGLPLPLISYGGTAIIFYCAAIGILLNISSQKIID